MEPSHKKRALATTSQSSDSDVSRNDSLANVPKSVRLASIPTEAKQPLVPYKSILKRLESNLQRKELCEEDYINCIETIIERDYFPDLIKLRHMRALQEAEKQGNDSMVELLKAKIAKLNEANNDTKPRDLVELKTLQNEKLRVNLGKGGIGLTDFCRIFTSEDNKSYDKLIHGNLLDVIQKEKWIENSELKNNLALADIQKKTNLGIKSGYVLTNREKARNDLFFASPKSEGIKQAKISAENATINSDQERILLDMELEQKIKRQEIIDAKNLEQLHDKVAAHGIRDYKDQILGQGFVTTPLVDHGDYQIPKPVAREELANQLLKKYATPKTKSGRPLNDATPLVISKLIQKYQKDSDMQLRRSYSRKGRSTASSCTGVSVKRRVQGAG